ncbi:MAG: carbohydrate ABC transporter permease [Anaerolineales bacterium]|jgi:multiple sugar transport system permease protein
MRWQKVLKRVLQYWYLIAFCAFSLFPIYWTFASSLKTPDETFAMPPKWVFVPTLHNYGVVFGLTIGPEVTGVTTEEAGGGSEFPRNLLNTVVIAAGSTIMSLVLGCGAAYSLTRGQVRGGRTVLAGTLLTRLIPPVVMLVPIYVLWRSLGLLDTHIGMMFAYLSFSLPFTIWMMYSFFLDIPAELEDAAAVDGCSHLQVLWNIVLPLSSPGLAATAVFLILGAWNDFLYSSVLTQTVARTVSPLILEFITDRTILWGRLYAAGATILIPVVVFTFLVQRYMGIGLTGGALKG